jgi:hypothetical protein
MLQVNPWSAEEQNELLLTLLLIIIIIIIIINFKVGHHGLFQFII